MLTQDAAVTIGFPMMMVCLFGWLTQIVVCKSSTPAISANGNFVACSTAGRMFLWSHAYLPGHERQCGRSSEEAAKSEACGGRSTSRVSPPKGSETPFLESKHDTHEIEEEGKEGDGSKAGDSDQSTSSHYSRVLWSASSSLERQDVPEYSKRPEEESIPPIAAPIAAQEDDGRPSFCGISSVSPSGRMGIGKGKDSNEKSPCAADEDSFELEATPIPRTPPVATSSPQPIAEPSHLQPAEDSSMPRDDIAQPAEDNDEPPPMATAPLQQHFKNPARVQAMLQVGRTLTSNCGIQEPSKSSSLPQSSLSTPSIHSSAAYRRQYELDKHSQLPPKEAADRAAALLQSASFQRETWVAHSRAADVLPQEAIFHSLPSVAEDQSAPRMKKQVMVGTKCNLFYFLTPPLSIRSTKIGCSIRSKAL